LLLNLSENLKQIVQRNPNALRLLIPAPQVPEKGAERAAVEPKTDLQCLASLGQKQETYDQVKELHRQGKKRREIADLLGIAVNTALKYVHLPEAPERQLRSSRKTSGFEAFIAQRWNEGAREAKQLFHELKERGYKGSYQTIARYVADLRSGTPVRTAHPIDHPQAPTPKVAVSKAVWVLGKPAEQLDEKERQLVEHLCHASDQVHRAYVLAQKFQKMVREQRCICQAKRGPFAN
jgi:transposase